MGSGILTQSADTKNRSGSPHVAFVTDQEVVKEHAQWRRSDTKEKIETKTRMDPAASSVLDGGGQCYLRGLRNSATVFWGRNCGRLQNVCMRNLRTRRE